MSDTAERVKRVIAEETGRELHELGPGVDLRRDLGLSDEDVGYLMREIESECDVVLDADEPAEVTTIGRLVRVVERRRDRFIRRRRA